MNKYVIDGKCYNPFHWQVDIFTCSCGLKLGDDISTKRFVWARVINEWHESERVEIVDMPASLEPTSSEKRAMKTALNNMLGRVRDTSHG